jgi:hypothetical protein
MKFALDTDHLGLKSLAGLFLVWSGWYIYSTLSLRVRMAKLGKQAVVTRYYLPFGFDTMIKAVIVRSSKNISLTGNQKLMKNQMLEHFQDGFARNGSTYQVLGPSIIQLMVVICPWANNNRDAGSRKHQSHPRNPV